MPVIEVPSLFGGTTHIPAKPGGDPTACEPFAVEWERYRKRDAEILANPFAHLPYRFDTLKGIAGKQDRARVFASRWLHDGSPDYAKAWGECREWLPLRTRARR